MPTADTSALCERVGLLQPAPSTELGGGRFTRGVSSSCQPDDLIAIKWYIDTDMPNHAELLKEFEDHARTAPGVKPLMQHIAHRLHEEHTRYNWVGFYLMESAKRDVLVVGPYAGSFSPTLRIPLDQGLCGAAATTGATVVVNDVPADPRYLGSDMVKSNLVVPIFVNNHVMAELCIESYFPNTFDSFEQRFLEACAGIVGSAMERQASTQTVPAQRR